MEENYKILIVDDEKDLCEILQFNLESEGFDIDIAYSGEEALKKPLQEFDLVLLDVMMSGMTGYKVANVIRKEMNLSTPIIFLTAKGEENDILTGFNVGGDDYISKPYSIKEVIARVKAILKRGIKTTTDSNVLFFKGLKVDVKKKSATIEEEKINLTRKEYEILSLLFLPFSIKEKKYKSKQLETTLMILTNITHLFIKITMLNRIITLTG